MTSGSELPRAVKVPHLPGHGQVGALITLCACVKHLPAHFVPLCSLKPWKCSVCEENPSVKAGRALEHLLSPEYSLDQSSEPQAAFWAHFTRNVSVFEFWQLSLGFFSLTVRILWGHWFISEHS